MKHYDFFGKKTYLIPNKQKKQLELYKNRYAIGVALTVLMAAFINNIYLLIGFGVVVLFYAEYVYRNKFLKGLTIVPNDEKPEKIINKQALIVNTILYLVFGVLLGYLSWSQTERFNRILLLAVAVGAVITAIQYFFVLLSRNN